MLRKIWKVLAQHHHRPHDGHTLTLKRRTARLVANVLEISTRCATPSASSNSTPRYRTGLSTLLWPIVGLASENRNRLILCQGDFKCFLVQFELSSPLGLAQGHRNGFAKTMVLYEVRNNQFNHITAMRLTVYGSVK